MERAARRRGSIDEDEESFSRRFKTDWLALPGQMKQQNQFISSDLRRFLEGEVGGDAGLIDELLSPMDGLSISLELNGDYRDGYRGVQSQEGLVESSVQRATRARETRADLQRKAGLFEKQEATSYGTTSYGTTSYGTTSYGITSYGTTSYGITYYG